MHPVPQPVKDNSSSENLSSYNQSLQTTQISANHKLKALSCFGNAQYFYTRLSNRNLKVGAKLFQL